MTHPFKYVLIVAALVATFWAAISWVTGFDADFRVAAVVAIVCLGLPHLLDYRVSEELRCGREAVWERRERECQADR